MYHLIALLIGFFVDLLLGDPHSIPHPVVWIGKLISAAEKLVRRMFPKTVRGENTVSVKDRKMDRCPFLYYKHGHCYSLPNPYSDA